MVNNVLYCLAYASACIQRNVINLTKTMGPVGATGPGYTRVNGQTQPNPVKHCPNHTDRMNTSPEEISIEAADGYRLGGTLFRVNDSKRVVIVHGATAVPHAFYRHFAHYLQSKGWSVLTYDYRGVGRSRPDSLTGFEARASDWGLLDMPAVLDWVRQTLGPKKIYFVGHSAGGQQAGLLLHPEPVVAMATVSSQSGFWLYQGGLEKIRVLLLTTVFLPLVSRLYGYFPWSRFAAGEDLPKQVAIQWARWCRSSKYILSDDTLPLDRYQQFRAPVLAYSVDDDNWGTKKAVDAMMSAYPNVERRHLVAHDYGISKLGHMGYFRPGAEKLWQEMLDWLQQH